MTINLRSRNIASHTFKGMTLVLSLLLAASCAQKKEADNRMEKVIAVHDAVMPKMSRIGQLISELEPLADSTAAGEPYSEAIEELKDANTGMMEWMQGFGDRFDQAEIQEGKALSAQKSAWLDEEVIKVEEMAEAMSRSIAKAELLLSPKESSE